MSEPNDDNNSEVWSDEQEIDDFVNDDSVPADLNDNMQFEAPNDGFFLSKWILNSL